MKTTPVVSRVVALICVLLTIVPVVFLLPQSLLWSWADLMGSIHDLAAYRNGTSSFVENRQHLIAFGFITLIIDLLCYVGSGCLIGIVFNLLSRRWQIVGWLAAILGAFGSVWLRKTMIGPETDHTFILMVIAVPIGVGVLSILGLILTAFRFGKL